MAARHRQTRKLAKSAAPSRVDCGECGKPAGLVTGALIYPGRREYAERPYWRCAACLAYVGCHPNSNVPLGTPAGPETRKARGEAHAALDPLWKRKIERDGVEKHEARGAAYKWLAAQIGTDPRNTHIGLMDVATARRVVEVCAPYVKR